MSEPRDAPDRGCSATTAERRELGPLAALSLVLGAVLGIGVFLTPVEMARGVGAPGWVFVVWLLSGGMAVSGALAYGELATRFPRAGGPYLYLREGFGEPLAFLYGWNCLLVMDPGLSAAIATGAAQYAAHVLPLSGTGQRGFALAVIALLALLTALGTRLAGGVIVALTLAKVGALLTLIGVGASRFDLGAVSPLFVRPEGSPALVGGLAGGFVAAFFSFGGWWEAAKIAGEVRSPRRTLPFVFAAGVGIATLLYLASSAVWLAAVRAAGLGPEALATMTAPDLGKLLLGPAGGTALAVLVVVFSIGALASSLLASPRLYVAMATDGLFPRRLAALHPRLGTPLGAIGVQATLAALLVVVGTFRGIIAYFIFATVAFITLSVAALFRLPEPPPDAYRAPARKWVAGLFIVLATLLLALLFAGNPNSSAAGVAVVALGYPVYRVLRRAAASPTRVHGGGAE